jgi:hypothetical protein
VKQRHVALFPFVQIISGGKLNSKAVSAITEIQKVEQTFPKRVENEWF